MIDCSGRSVLVTGGAGFVGSHLVEELVRRHAQVTVVYDLMRKIFENPHELFIYGDGTQVRDFNHVANVVAAFLVVADRALLEGEVYNVAAEEPVCIQDLAGMICEQMGVAPRFVYSGNVRPGDAQRRLADISRLKSLSYQPQLGLTESLTDTVAWFRQETM